MHSSACFPPPKVFDESGVLLGRIRNYSHVEHSPDWDDFRVIVDGHQYPGSLEDCPTEHADSVWSLEKLLTVVAIAA